MAKIIWNGKAGEKWSNDTGAVAYQFVAALDNTCGTCLQIHMAISPHPWPIPIHHGCRCRQTLIKPDSQADPFVDFREVLDGMSESQKTAAVGKSNYKLIKEGVVPWEEVVTPSRVRTLREVVARRKLTVKRLTGAGVRSDIAEDAHASVHTPEHEIVNAHRQSMVENLKGAGLTDEQIRRAFGERIAEKISIGMPEGPLIKIGREPTPLETLVPNLAALLKLNGKGKKKVAMKAAEKEKAAEPLRPKTPLEIARDALRDAEREQAEASGSTDPNLPHRIDPTLPIADRLKAYTLGDAKVKAIQEYRKTLMDKAFEATRKYQDERSQLMDQVMAAKARYKPLLEAMAEAEAKGNAIEATRIAVEFDALTESMIPFNRKIEELWQKIRKIRMDAVKKTIEILHQEPGKAVTFKARDAEPGAKSREGNLKAPSKGDKATIGKAMDWMSPLVRKGDGQWSDVIDLKVGVGLKYRAHHAWDTWDDAMYHVQLKVGEEQSVVIHEYGHGIDARIMAGDVKVGKRSREFLEYRIGKQTPEQLNKVFPDSKYEDHEIGADDDFAKAHDGDTRKAFYAGKIYKEGRDSSEILSMGLELLHADPAGFAAKDPEWFKYVAGVLDGSLR